MIITYRYKPDEMLITYGSFDKVELSLLDKLKAITGIKYKVTKLQKEPSFCYNTYVRLISSSSAASQDKLKHFLKYFRKDKNANFVKTSYKEITVNLVPSSKEEFLKFLSFGTKDV